MQLSQEWLNQLATCPHKFQLIYLDRLAIPISPEEQERLNWGAWLHLLMQRRELGIETQEDYLASETEQQLQQCVDRLVTAVSIFRSQPAWSQQSEHRRMLYLQGHLLTAVYDLLILEEHQAQILDWKTSSCPSVEELAKDWQTRLYLFVLAETSSYAPEQISMTYWFVQPDREPQSLQFNYSQMLHQQTQQDLLDLLGQLDQWLERYKTGMPFPQVNALAGYCNSCTFINRCQRGHRISQELAQEPSVLAEIEEVML